MDHGLSNIGLAIHDTDIYLSWPIDVIKFNTWQVNLKQIIDKYSICKIVIGWPLMLNGEEGEQCRHVDLFIDELRTMFTSEIIKQDERFTNHIVRTQYNVNHDSISAMTILENYLKQYYSSM